MFAMLPVFAVLNGCESDSRPPARAPEPGVLGVETRWECCWPEARPGFTVRLTLSLWQRSLGTEDCPTLPAEARVWINDRPGVVVEAGGPGLGGLSGTEPRGCKQEALVEAGPFTREEVRLLRVRVEEAGTLAQAELGDALEEAPLAAALPATVKSGAELVLDLDPSSLTFLTYAELEWQEEGAFRQRGSLVLGERPTVRLRIAAPPGRATLTMVGRPVFSYREVPRCEGFSRCSLWRTAVVGPAMLEVLP